MKNRAGVRLLGQGPQRCWPFWFCIAAGEEPTVRFRNLSRGLRIVPSRAKRQIGYPDEQEPFGRTDGVDVPSRDSCARGRGAWGFSDADCRPRAVDPPEG